jgi:tripartite-type tricarboxylate transporter receptor subunit TctC
LVIINQAGGIGTIGSREVKNAPPDGYKILCHHNAIITAKLAGTVTYGPEAFEPIAMTGEMSMVILVRADAPYETVVDLLEHAKSQPRRVRFGANKGAPAYFTSLQLEQAYPGAEFSVVSSGGGADRYSKILGGHLEAGIFSLSEYLDFRAVEGTPPDQDIRAIAVLGERRHDSIAEVPTATELGVPVVLSNANYWWAPKGTPVAVLEKLSGVLEAAMNSPAVRSELRRLRMDPTFDSGPSLERRLRRTIESFEAVAGEKPTSLPNFPGYVGAIVLALLLCVLVQTSRNKDAADDIGQETRPRHTVRPGLALACFLVVCLYVLGLQAQSMPFALVTAAMAALLGGMMLRYSPGKWSIALELALLTGLGTQFVFSEIFATPLP